MSGARADQSNVTLDGIDVNDGQNQNAFTSVLRLTLDSVQEFRVTTSSYGADGGRSSGPQVSLVTKSGTNSLRGAGYYVNRDTKFSSNEYFNKLSQLKAGHREQVAAAEQEHLRRLGRRTDPARIGCSTSATSRRCARSASRSSSARCRRRRCVTAC